MGTAVAGSCGADPTAALTTAAPVDWPDWVIGCLARHDGAGPGPRQTGFVVCRVRTDLLGQVRVRLICPGAAGARARVVHVDRVDPGRAAARLVSGWLTAARLADRGLDLGVVHAVPRGEPYSPPRSVCMLARERPGHWLAAERVTLLLVADLALALGRWPEAAAIVRLVEASRVAIDHVDLDRVRRAVTSRQRRAAEAAGLAGGAMFRSEVRTL